MDEWIKNMIWSGIIKMWNKQDFEFTRNFNISLYRENPGKIKIENIS